MSSSSAPLDLITQMIYEATGETLSDLQRLILQECWTTNKKTYEEIALRHNYASSYIQQRIAPSLWRLISETVGTKVTKSNFRNVLTQHIEQLATQVEAAQAKEAQAEETQTEVPASTDVELSAAPPDITEADVTAPAATSPKPPSAQTSTFSSDLASASVTSASIDPSSPLMLPMGSVPLGSRAYIERQPQESDCYRAIRQPGALIRIQSPGKMGKTSLMNRIIAQVPDYSSVVINCEQCDLPVLCDLNKFLRWFCRVLTIQLRLPVALDDYWEEEAGSKMSCTFYIEDGLLVSLNRPLVLAIENISELFRYPDVAQAFLSMLRAWHGYTKYNEQWQSLRLILDLSTESYLSLNINQPPFNEGMEVSLPPFKAKEVLYLAERHGLTLDRHVLDQLMQLLGGHPHLTRLWLYHVASKRITRTEILATANTDEGIFKAHLQHYLWHLQQHPEVKVSFKAVLNQKEPVRISQIQSFKLSSLGLVTLHGDKVKVSCQLYREYFRKSLYL